MEKTWIVLAAAFFMMVGAKAGLSAEFELGPERSVARCGQDGCPDWEHGEGHALGGAVQRPQCCCEAPDSWPRLERFEGNVQKPHGGQNTAAYCGIEGNWVVIYKSIDNVNISETKHRATPRNFDLDSTILAASIGAWSTSPGSGEYGEMGSHVARFRDDFWLKIDLGSFGYTRTTRNDSPEAAILREYLDDNCGPWMWDSR